MCASPLGFFRSGPPPPRVVLLPDALFFTRAIPIAAGATPAEAAAQVELALEAMAPFPLSHLYYGWYWRPGAESAFVFASYRRRFTTEQTAAWPDAELVLPTFAALFGAEVQPATTVLLATPESLTAVHWETPGIPSRVLCRPLPPDATDEQRAAARDDVLRELGGSRQVIELAEPPAPEPSRSDRETVFRAGELTARLDATTVAAMDVRDKAELAALRGSRQRDVLLWRTTLGAVAALLLLAIGELLLVGGDAWQQVRRKQVNAQRPIVEQIKASADLAQRIDELATKRLLPFEMISILTGEDGKRKPAEIWFTSVQTSTANGIYTIVVNAQATDSGQIGAYEAALRSHPAVESVTESGLNTSAGAATFILVVTFKPNALKAAGPA